MLKRKSSDTLLLCVMLGSSSLLWGQAQGGAPQLGGSSTLSGMNTSNGNRVTRGPAGMVGSVPEDFSNLKLGSGFLLSLNVYDMPDISGELRVDPAGNVDVPLSGPVHVAGMTLTEAKAAIQKKLVDARILKNPQINLDVVQYAGDNITILGEVQSPGRLQLLAPHSLEQILGMVGGETQLAGSTIEVRHAEAGGATQIQQIKYDRSSNSDVIKTLMVYPGDTINIPRAGIVYVMGAVNRPGGYVMQENGKLDVAQALSMAYGTSMNAKIGDIRVVRKDHEGTLKEIPIDYKKITQGKVDSLALQAGDLVYVPVSKVKTVFTSGMGIMASTSSALIYTH